LTRLAPAPAVRAAVAAVVVEIGGVAAVVVVGAEKVVAAAEIATAGRIFHRITICDFKK
jgi:hypothetical protein